MQQPRDPTEVMGPRIVAYIIDFILFFGIFIVLMVLTKDHAYTGAPAGACATLRDRGISEVCIQFGHRVYTWKNGQAALGYLLSAVIGLLNIVVLQGITGASIGKHIMSLRVVNAQGQPCGVGRALLRSLLLIVDNLFCFLVGLLFAALTHPHRRVGDMAAGTYVVAVADAGTPVLVGAPAPYPYAYQQAAPPGWAPPTGQPPGNWGAPPAPPAWGGPAPQAPPPTWGAPPPPGPPTWGTTPPAAAPDPSSPPTWPAPAEPTPPLPVDRTGWGAPPSPWRTPPSPEASPPAAPTPPPPAPPTPPPPAPAPAPAPSADPAAPAPPDAPVEGESWWNKAVTDDDEPEQ